MFSFYDRKPVSMEFYMKWKFHFNALFNKKKNFWNCFISLFYISNRNTLPDIITKTYLIFYFSNTYYSIKHYSLGHGS